MAASQLSEFFTAEVGARTPHLATLPLPTPAQPPATLGDTPPAPESPSSANF